MTHTWKVNWVKKKLVLGRTMRRACLTPRLCFFFFCLYLNNENGKHDHGVTAETSATFCLRRLREWLHHGNMKEKTFHTRSVTTLLSILFLQALNVNAVYIRKRATCRSGGRFSAKLPEAIKNRCVQWEVKEYALAMKQASQVHWDSYFVFSPLDQQDEATKNNLR